jgi:hypothetical protein
VLRAGLGDRKQMQKIIYFTVAAPGITHEGD